MSEFTICPVFYGWIYFLQLCSFSHFAVNDLFSVLHCKIFPLSYFRAVSCLQVSVWRIIYPLLGGLVAAHLASQQYEG